jgi:hypothetical protein
MEVASKTCLTCGKTVRGRSDKKFCDDYCRNNYNNQLKAGDNNYVRNINNTLRKNRRILHAILPGNEEAAKTTRKNLITAAFYMQFFQETKKLQKQPGRTLSGKVSGSNTLRIHIPTKKGIPISSATNMATCH